MLEAIGDRETEAADTAQAINDGLEEYVYQEQERGVKGQSVDRTMCEALSAFRRVSKGVLAIGTQRPVGGGGGGTQR